MAPQDFNPPALPSPKVPSLSLSTGRLQQEERLKKNDKILASTKTQHPTPRSTSSHLNQTLNTNKKPTPPSNTQKIPSSWIEPPIIPNTIDYTSLPTPAQKRWTEDACGEYNETGGCGQVSVDRMLRLFVMGDRKFVQMRGVRKESAKELQTGDFEGGEVARDVKGNDEDWMRV